MKRKKIITILIGIVVALLAYIVICNLASSKLFDIYQSRQSKVVTDRDGAVLAIEPNEVGYFAEYIKTPPEELTKPLLEQEDKYFYYHFGFNPISITRALKNTTTNNPNRASSTITQQLVKVLLENEFDRTIKNKALELFYAISLEATYSKDEILTMYLNSIFFGNNVQGVKSASKLYFDKTPETLSEQEFLQLLTTIRNPSNANPFADTSLNDYNKNQISELQSGFAEYVVSEAAFEITNLPFDCGESTSFTIDGKLTDTVRDIVKRNLAFLIQKDASNSAVVVMKIPENEVLTIVGSPDPSINSYGYKINMATQPRPIGSTIKPFIYLNGFEKDLRPYTFVEDKEYKYIIGTGFALYPKNYDYQYRGKVSLHYALSNSLNVPTVKVLEYVGLDDFNNFLTSDLGFKPVQSLDNYQLGIALGGLEMDLLSLSYYFSSLPAEGGIRPLQICNDPSFTNQTGADFSLDKQISEQKYVQLINKILSDRKTGIEQFGIKSNLNLSADNYAVKTGTSRSYHDSWTVGYTPDFLVGVWVGNSENTPMDEVSGATGAGAIWNETMNLLLNSKYNQHSQFDDNLVHEFIRDGSIEYGLSDDDFEKYQELMVDDALIISPYNNDTFLLQADTQIPLKASQKVVWYINDQQIGEDTNLLFSPQKAGQYSIIAKTDEGEETVVIFVEEDE